MGRPRTATEILRTRGYFKKTPQRARPNEPKPAGAFKKRAPPWLTAAQRKEWRKILSIAPPGVLGNSDELLVGICACLLAEFHKDPEAMTTARITRLTAELSKLGLSPSARAGMTAVVPRRNQFDDV
jgi:phage terminase small subunit